MNDTPAAGPARGDASAFGASTADPESGTGTTGTAGHRRPHHVLRGVLALGGTVALGIGLVLGGGLASGWLGGASGSGAISALPALGLDGSGSTTSSGITTATDDQQRGAAIIETVLGYGNGEAAGSGIVLTSDGLVLTNHHVVEGATEISVTIPSTGRTYTASVAGTDADKDVALLRLQGASDLATADFDDDGVSTGETLTAIGNAEGRGELVAASGAVTDTDRGITTSSTSGEESEQLSGLIEFQADVVSGDSGGPVLDSDGQVVAMTVAASTSGGSGSSGSLGAGWRQDEGAGSATTVTAGQRESAAGRDGAAVGGSADSGVVSTVAGPTPSGTALGSSVSGGSGSFGGAGSSGATTTTGYAIPIDTVLAVADQIRSGEGTDEVHIGGTAFLGVTLSSSGGSRRGGSGSSGSGSSGSGSSGSGSGLSEGSGRNGFGSSANGSSAGSSRSSASGALIAGVVDGGPADEAGITAGSTITAIDGTTVTGATRLSELIGDHAVGDQVTVTWTDAQGASHTATVTLAEGPVA